jgi:DNA-binding transcriptional regulator YhcF (GntR family)
MLGCEGLLVFEVLLRCCRLCVRVGTGVISLRGLGKQIDMKYQIAEKEYNRLTREATFTLSHGQNFRKCAAWP